MNSDLEDNIQLSFLECARRATNLTSQPVLFVIDLSSICNYKCAKCGYHSWLLSKKNSFSPFPTYESLKKILENNTFHSIIYGGCGEPLLNNKICKILDLEYTSKHALVITNGELFTEDLLIKFKRHHEDINITFSIDTLNRSAYKLHVGKHDADISKIITKIKNLTKQNNITINVVVSALNYNKIYALGMFFSKLSVHEVNYIKIVSDIDFLMLTVKHQENVLKLIDKTKKLKTHTKFNFSLSFFEKYADGVYCAKQDSLKILEEKFYNAIDSEDNHCPCNVSNIFTKSKYHDNIDSFSRRVVQKDLFNNTQDNFEAHIPYCIAPWRIILQESNHNVRPCCGLINFDVHERSNTNKHESLFDIWNCEEFQYLRDCMFNLNQLPDNCKRCTDDQRFWGMQEFIITTQQNGGLFTKKSREILDMFPRQVRNSCLDVLNPPHQQENDKQVSSSTNNIPLKIVLAVRHLNTPSLISMLLKYIITDYVNAYRLLSGGALDASWYLTQYSDVAAGTLNPALHYLRYGWKEGRNPNSWFDTKKYLANYPDVVECGMNPLLHYCLHGVHEGRKL